MQLLEEDKDCLLVLDTVKKTMRSNIKCLLKKGAWKEKRNENKEEGEGEIS